MSRSTSLVRRVAQGSALAASAAALLAAFATIALSTGLIRRAEDRRLEDAAVTFAEELDRSPTDIGAITEVHRDESEEMNHTGMLFAVHDPQGRLLVGNRRLGLPSAIGCTNADALRVCRQRSARGLVVVVGAARSTLFPTLVGAAVMSVLLAAALAWIASRPISRHIVAPLTRLRSRIADLEANSLSEAHLGPPDDVIEVDALRSTIGQMITRLERALELAHRFAANAAHELRTPLTALRAELELLSENLRDPTLRADASRAEQKVAELSVLVERLLILSVPTRAETDAHEIVSLRDLLEDAVAAFPAADHQRIAVSEEDALVKGDATLLATMIVNAIANGLKFGNHASTRVSVSERDAIIHIDDDGPGIVETDRERVFEPFFRSQQALQRRLPGHGLGLALVRHIAQTHGGRAAFVTKAEPGTRLEIRLPAAEES